MYIPIFAQIDLSHFSFLRWVGIKIER